MERLTKMIDGVPCYIGACKKHDEEIAAELSDGAVREILLRLSEFEGSGFNPNEVHELSEAYADNRLYILPCHIGDTLYCLDDGHIYKVKVRSMRIHEDGVTILYHFNKFGYCEGSGVFGKTLFLTKEDAEEKRRENHEEA